MTLLEQQLVQPPRVKTVVLEGAEHSFRGFEQAIVADVSRFIANEGE
jgi:hypothetical protein